MFGTSGIRGPVGETVTTELALALGGALAIDADRVVVGRDPRDTGRVLADALAAGLMAGGADVVRLGLAATPTVARSVAWCDADAGVSVTASHNPPPDNGFKLWQPSGQAFDAPRRATIAERLDQATVATATWDEFGDSRTWDARDRHVAAVVDAVAPQGAPSVVLDVGNGAGGLTADALRALGCRVDALNAQPDGTFPGRPSEPTAEHCAELCAYVADGDADLGLAHDGDADRLLAVAGDGTWVGGDALLALFARAAATDGDRVAVPVDTSLAVDDALAEVGATAVRTPVGDVYVAEAASRPGVCFGGEPSGAWIWPGETLCPDGTLAAAKLVEFVAAAGPLGDLVADLPTYPIRRTSVETDEKAAVMDRVTEAVAERYDDVDDLDGVRVDLGDAWFLLRASGTQPLVRVTAEARDEGRVDDVFAEARGIVEAAMD